MFKAILLLSICIYISCKTPNDKSGNPDKFDPSKTYQLRLNPSPGSSYHYDITNETVIKMEVDDKKVDNRNTTDIGILYSISKDSSGNYLFSSAYDKIKVHTKNNDAETELDAANGSFSLNPAERMMGLLKGEVITAIITDNGNVIEIKGLAQLGDKIMAGFNNMNEDDKKKAREQWDDFVGKGLIKRNFDQLFKFFPDSAVHLGDEWRITERQEAELSYNITNTYTLKAVNTDFAIIESSGKITTSGNAPEATSLGLPLANLEGEQSGHFELETQTGMLLSCQLKTKMKGTVTVLNTEVPVSVTIHVNIKGQKKLP